MKKSCSENDFRFPWYGVLRVTYSATARCEKLRSRDGAFILEQCHANANSPILTS